jgi:D-cysteine desulfhydrase
MERTESMQTEGKTTTRRYPLYARYPPLEETLPRIPLSPLPSPVKELTCVAGKCLWIKNDGVYGTLYGGNKPRKLELVLPDVLAMGRRTLITFGALGTNHGLATSLYAREQGLRTVLLLIDQPVTTSVQRELCWLHASGAVLRYVGNDNDRMRREFRFCRWRYADWLRRKRPYVLPGGGSSVLGTVGFVNAGLELADQVAAGELPEPSRIVVALGSMGTAAGLALGLRLGGLKSKVVAVQIGSFGMKDAVAKLANDAGQLLRERGAEIGDVKIELADIEIVTDCVGEGYGHPTPEGDRAIALLKEKDGIELEPTYTAKAAAASLRVAEEASPDSVILYWHTYNALPVPLSMPQPGDYRKLPRPFHRFFEAPSG